MRRLNVLFKDTLVGGLVFWIPLFAVILILKKFYTALTGPVSKFAGLLGIDAGAVATPILVSVFLLVIFFLSGLILRIGFLRRSRNWIDTQLCIYIPGYDFYKRNLITRIDPEAAPEGRTAVLLTVDSVSRPGYIVETLDDGRLVVFVPTKPDAPDGSIIIVPPDKVQKLKGGEKRLGLILQHQGKGLDQWLQDSRQP
jgi:uncharacterized membrane protein